VKVEFVDQHSDPYVVVAAGSFEHPKNQSPVLARAFSRD